MQAQRPGDILLVDADPAFLNSVSPALQRAGHTVTTCQSAREARYLLERYSYDVVLCAMHLPDEDGRSLCHAIKSTPEMLCVSCALLVNTWQELEAIARSAPQGAIDAGMGSYGRVSSEQNGNRATNPATLSVDELAPPDEYLTRTLRGEEWNGRVQSLLRLRRYQEEIYSTVGTLMRIAEGIEEQDKHATGHCKRLSVMAVELGAVLGCDELQLTALERAAFLHDIGKVSIPGAIVQKAERLSPREMEIIQSHCVLGERLCQDVNALRSVLPIIRHHHERADGSGYPDRLQGEEIPILAQIFSIADIYDALRMWRPFRPPMAEAQALDVMGQEVDRGYWNRLIFSTFREKVLPGLEDRLSLTSALWPRGEQR